MRYKNIYRCRQIDMDIAKDIDVDMQIYNPWQTLEKKKKLGRKFNHRKLYSLVFE